jgi:hypothetical protein
MMDLAVEKQTIGIIPYFVFCPTLNTVLDKAPLPQPLAMIRETDQKLDVVRKVDNNNNRRDCLKEV